MTTQTISPPNKHKFAIVLENIGKLRPRVDVDSWTVADAAEHWCPGYDSGDDHNPLPATVITGIVARLFAQEYFHTNPMAGLMQQWRQKGRAAETYSQVHRPESADRLVHLETGLPTIAQWLHCAYRPDFEKQPAHGPYVQWIRSDTVGYCGRKTCKYRGSAVSGCIKEYVFLNLESRGYFVSWGSVRWEGLATLFPLMRNSLDTPYIPVRRERSHIKRAVIPYYAADAFNNLSRIVPALLLSSDFARIVKDRLPKYVTALKTERLRFHAIVAMGSDPAKAMREWDASFSTAAWDSESLLGDTGETPYDYANGALLGVNSDEHEKLADTVARDLFPALPNLPSDEDSDDSDD